jgi:hypothetical protein
MFFIAFGSPRGHRKTPNEQNAKSNRINSQKSPFVHGILNPRCGLAAQDDKYFSVC